MGLWRLALAAVLGLAALALGQGQGPACLYDTDAILHAGPVRVVVSRPSPTTALGLRLDSKRALTLIEAVAPLLGPLDSPTHPASPPPGPTKRTCQ